MNDYERETLELKHRMDLHDQDEVHSREENDQAHASLNGRIDSVTVRIDGHDEKFVRQDARIEDLETKGTKNKAKIIDGMVKWILGFLALALTSGGMFLLGSLFGGGR